MGQLRQLWDKLSWSQRIWLFVAALAVGGGLVALSRWNDERDFKPLYSNLAPEDAGELVAKLKEGGIGYRLGDNGATVLVSSARVAEARLTMAAQGLPKSGRIGYELFDKANFGASDFAEQVNYHRAIEGELERSIMSIREVEQARVHITMAKDSIYSESRQPAKASILVKLRAGSRLSPLNITAICQLAANAVPELAPEQVSLVDTNGNLLNRARRVATADDDSEVALDYRKNVEKDLQAKIAATLEPLLGADHFRAGVSAEVDITSAEQSEENYDSQKAAVLSSQTRGRSGAAGGVRRTGDGLEPPAPDIGALHRIVELCPKNLQHDLPAQPRGQAREAAARLAETDVARGAGGSYTALRRNAARRGSSIGGKTENRARPGGRVGGTFGRSWRSTGSGILPLRVDARGGASRDARCARRA